MVRFLNRKYELDLLEKEGRKKEASFIVLYGRRRTGKTRLLTEYMKGKNGLYIIAEDTNKAIQLRDIKNKLAEFFKDEFLQKTEIQEWSNLFQYISKIINKNKKWYFCIDEFSYLIKNDPSIISALQKWWDLFLKDTQTCFILSGSLFGLIEEKVLSSASPLYGRRTRDIMLNPLSLQYAILFTSFSFEEQLQLYMSIGGIPEYLLKAGPYDNFSAFMQDEFFMRDGYFFREPYFILSQEFKEIKTYFSLIQAIAYGNTKPGEIADFIGISSKEIYPYLENLIRLGIIKKEIPLFGKRKQGIYLIKDMFFDAWFNFVYPHREEIEQGNYQPKKEAMHSYFGKRFEMLIMELFSQIINKPFMQIGKWWYKENEIDIVAYNETEIFFAECKWKEQVNAEEELQILKEKTPLIPSENKKRKENYLIFAKSFKKKIKGVTYDLADLKKIITAKK